jgi:hypothetical protein
MKCPPILVGKCFKDYVGFFFLIVVWELLKDMKGLPILVGNVLGFVSGFPTFLFVIKKIY